MYITSPLYIHTCRLDPPHREGVPLLDGLTAIDQGVIEKGRQNSSHAAFQSGSFTHAAQFYTEKGIICFQTHAPVSLHSIHMIGAFLLLKFS